MGTIGITTTARVVF